MSSSGNSSSSQHSSPAEAEHDAASTAGGDTAGGGTEQEVPESHEVSLDETALFDALLLALRSTRDGHVRTAAGFVPNTSDGGGVLSHDAAIKMLHDMRGDDPMFLRLKDALLAETF